jgi:type I restriction enzyme S subunit
MRSEGGDGATTIGDHVMLQRGTTYKSALLGQPGPVLLGLASIQRNGGFLDTNLKTYGGDSPKKLLLGPGDLYVALKDVTQSGDLLGAVARVPVSLGFGRLTQDTVRLDVIDSNLPRSYLYWLLRTPEYRAYCRARATGTTNLSLSRADFLAFPVPPPTADRLAVVEILELLDGKIDSNRRLARVLEEIAQTEFQARFVDFVGVENLEDSELGQIPVGWRARVLGDIGVVHRDLIKGANELPYVGLDLMPRSSTVLTEWREKNAPTGQAALFEIGDILFGKLRPYFRKVGVAPIVGRCSTEILVLRPVRPEYYGVLLGHVASEAFIEHCVAVSRGTRMPRAEWKDASAFKIAIPPTEAAAAFTALVWDIYAKNRCLTHESRTLGSIRDALLPELISGRTSVLDTTDPGEINEPLVDEAA